MTEATLTKKRLRTIVETVWETIRVQGTVKVTGDDGAEREEPGLVVARVSHDVERLVEEEVPLTGEEIRQRGADHAEHLKQCAATAEAAARPSIEDRVAALEAAVGELRERLKPNGR